MKPGTKMLLMANRDREKERGNDRRYGGMEYGADTNYDVEGRFRDRRGREHYDNGRFAPRNDMDEMEDNYGPESRRYRRDDAGRFRSEYPHTPIVPPVYQDERMEMNRIGFALEPRRELEHDYQADANYPRMDEMAHRTSPTTMGHAKGAGMTLTREMAEEWMKGLENEDGSKGPHWTLEQIKQVIAQRGLKADPVEFWAVLNMMYSDYCPVFKKHNVNQIDIYVDMANAWINDKDAGEGKTAKYLENVVMQ